MMKLGLFTVMLFALIITVFSYDDDCSGCSQLKYLACLETYKWDWLRDHPFTNAIDTLLRDIPNPTVNTPTIIYDVTNLFTAIINGLTTTPPECTHIQ